MAPIDEQHVARNRGREFDYFSRSWGPGCFHDTTTATESFDEYQRPSVYQQGRSYDLSPDEPRRPRYVVNPSPNTPSSGSSTPLGIDTPGRFDSTRNLLSRNSSVSARDYYRHEEEAQYQIQRTGTVENEGRYGHLLPRLSPARDCVTLGNANGQEQQNTEAEETACYVADCQICHRLRAEPPPTHNLPYQARHSRSDDQPGTSFDDEPISRRHAERGTWSRSPKTKRGKIRGFFLQSQTAFKVDISFGWRRSRTVYFRRNPPPSFRRCDSSPPLGPRLPASHASFSILLALDVLGAKVGLSGSNTRTLTEPYFTSLMGFGSASRNLRF